MKILIACDSFKDALDAPSVCKAIEKGLQRAFVDQQLSTHTFPLADGGEGMAAILNAHLGLTSITVTVHDPLFRPIEAAYSISTDGSTVFIEMALAAGLQLLQKNERNPLKTTTFGVGELISHALKKGATRIILGLGGSATNDLGMGMAAALGWRFIAKNGAELSPTGENLVQVEQIIPPPTPLPPHVIFETMSDVVNPLCGEAGAAKIYAPQKGAGEAAISLLEEGAINFAVKARLLRAVDEQAKGAGAAGGLGFGAAFFLNATNKSGIEMMMDLTDFDAQVVQADVIITGEGRLDHQTANGKLIAGIVRRSQNKPVIALCGALNSSPNEVLEMGLTAAFSIGRGPGTLAAALALTAENLEQTAFNLGRVLKI